MNERQLFDFMLEQVDEKAKSTGLASPQAFPRWFIDIFFNNPIKIIHSDGSHDGKVDSFFRTEDGKAVIHHVVNSKFTANYGKKAPPAFYQEMSYLIDSFSNVDKRSAFLEEAVAQELRPYYAELYERFDHDFAKLYFVTSCRKNEAYFCPIENQKIEVFHLDDLLQHLVDDLDIAMPRTEPLSLEGINSVLSPDLSESGVSTSIAFARLIDFIDYMKNDPHGFLFARNVRVSLGSSTPVNREIRGTFANAPVEFVYSNNGVTILCESHNHNPGTKLLKLVNPRVVNGAQTLHCVRDVPSPSKTARIMVRIIAIPAPSGKNALEQRESRKAVINRISVRSNQQNPIKLWNLVANDDFQLALFRFFRRKKLFYERRPGEWKLRKRALKSVGIERGPGIKQLTQAISSYYWREKKLGPVVARGSVAQLFETNSRKRNDGTSDGSEMKAYEFICKTTPELAYQIYLVHENVEWCYHLLTASGSRPAFFSAMKGYVSQTLLSMVVRSLQEIKVPWGKPSFTVLLERQWSDSEWETIERQWRDLVEACARHIRGFYVKQAGKFKKTEGADLQYANYFKSQMMIGEILNAAVPRSVVSLAKGVVSQVDA